MIALSRSGMKLVAVVLGLGGAALFAVLLASQDIAAIAAALAGAGWALVVVVAFHVVPMAADTASWRVLFERTHRPPFRSLLWMRWVGESVNSLLPAAQVGGDVARARLAALSGVPAPLAAATVIADLTMGILSQVAFILLGLGLLLWLLGDGAAEIVLPVLLGLVVAALLFGAFYGAQRAGLFAAVARLAGLLARGDAWAALATRAEKLDRTLAELYRRRRDVAASVVWTLIAWVVGAGEVWLAFWALGVPVTIVEAIVLESAAQAVRSIMFPVPGALGVQEGGILLVAGLLGIPPETAMAMALAKRARELAWGIPGLVVWPILEGRRAWARSAGPPR